MNRRISAGLVVLGLLAAGGWMLWWGGQPETPMMTSQIAVPASAIAEPPTTPAAAASSAPTSDISATREVPTAYAAATTPKALARARFDVAWTCLNRQPYVEPGDPAEIWPATLPPEHQRRAEQDHAQVMAWAERNCRGLPAQLLDQNGQLSLPDLLTLASSGADDPRRQLAAALRARERTRDPANADAVRAALETLLRSALEDPAAAELQLIGAVVSAQGPAGEFGPDSGAAIHLQPMVWALAACDLGADCGPRSPVLRQLCLQSLLCGYPNLESAVIDGVWPQGMSAALQEERRRLVERLRHAGGVGVFEPVTPPAGGG